MTNTKRILSATALALVTAVGVMSTTGASAPAALFHTALKKSWPAKGDTVTALPAKIDLWFSEAVELPVVTVKLSMPGGAMPITLGKLVRADTSKASISAPVTGALHDGTWTVQWSVASKDGHPATGKFDFVVKVAK